MNRWKDWWDQGERDLRHARHALDDSDYEWSAFAAQQAAEEALKALIMARGGEPWGHSITGLVEALPRDIESQATLTETANRLDKHYLPARYPNGFASGYPGKLYTRGEAEGPLGMRTRSSSSAGAFYLDRDRRIEELRASVRRAAARLSGVQRVILFGSLVHGIPTPRSDADLLVVVSESIHEEPRDRVPDVIGAMSPLPCPVDLFVLTAQEVERYTREGQPLLREVLAHGRDLI